MNNKIDQSTILALREIYHENEWTKPFFEWAAARQKDANVTTIERLESLTDINYYDLVKLARMLEEIGVVKFVSGRKGFKSRIEWKFSVKNVGAASMGETDKLQEVGLDVEDDSFSEEEDKEEGSIEHVFALRPGKTIKILLPEDFSVREAERLASFIQTLPFGG